jgi:hypothetical protein
MVRYRPPSMRSLLSVVSAAIVEEAVHHDVMQPVP